ncbi:MAG: hypothetical protein EB069_07625, partial [Actinobacteria bacterium]|nr:hypothetical protein [Actinomycetota bacterium]
MPAVSNTDITRFPYSAVGYIYAVWSNGTGRGGVASVIGKNDVITALTNVYKPDLGWASEINFYFGADYNVASNRFDNTPYSLTSGFRWSATGYNSQLFIDSDNETFLQSEAQYNVAIIGLSEEIGLKTGWFGLDPGRDSNGQTFSAVGFSGTDGMVNTVTTVDKSTFAGVYTSATNPFGGKNDIGQGSPIFSAEGYLVGIKATTNWWADIGFLYSFITAELEVNNKLLIASKDTIAPTLVSVSPSNNATRVAVNTNLTITFSEAIERGNGLLLLKDGSGKVIEAFDVRSSSRLTVSGSTIVINPVNDLFYSTQYQLEIPKDAIKDLAGNSYLGLQAYNFTTVWITPTVSIEDATSVEGDDGVKTINFKISLSNAIPIDINLEARTLAGTASTASGDYNGFSTRLITIPAGRLTFDLAVEINGDKKFEPNEGFSVEILNATSANLGDAYARGWIIDDDEPYRLPTDTSARYQWHLYPEVGANIFPVWRDWNGTGIKVAIFDQGIDPTHPDLNDNLLLSLGRKASNLSVGGDPILSIDNHGTPVAGVIAAESNGLGVIGVAPKASLVSIYSPLSSSPASFSAEIVNAFTYAKAFDILNNSWGFGNYSSLGSSYPWAFLDNFRSTTFSKAGQALKSLAENGRNGLGTVVVQSAGNSYSLGDDTNLHNFQNSRYIITVAGTDYQGTATSYSSPGSSVLIAAPGGEVNINNDQLSKIFTTDRVGLAGYGSGDYTFISGTSFSGPIVSGVVALMLDANPLLGYRDVQQIIAYSGRRIAESENTWAYNGAKNWNGGGLHFDSVTHNLGFGLIDTLTAVRLAETWTSPAL